MTEKIEPALTPEEWQSVLGEDHAEDLLFFDQNKRQEQPPAPIRGRWWNGTLAGFIDGDLNIVAVSPGLKDLAATEERVFVTGPDPRYTDRCEPVHGAARYIRGRDRQRLAALCLHGQPFGFTWEMVDLLDEMVEVHQSDVDYLGGLILDPDGLARLRQSKESLASWKAIQDRIAALLPPRE